MFSRVRPLCAVNPSVWIRRCLSNQQQQRPSRKRRMGDDVVCEHLRAAVLQEFQTNITTHQLLIEPEVEPFSSKIPLVITSLSDDPHINLAFEDWLSQQPEILERRTMFLWINRPVVVVGRNQNAWVECNLPLLRSNNIWLARRKSGGGSVYHDHGNLNVTFFSTRSAQDKHKNSNILKQALINTQWNFEVEINDRNDLTLHGDKISGSAYKLAKSAAYHHCTLLVNSNLKSLAGVLTPTTPQITTKGIPSVKSPVTNLFDHQPDVNMQDVLQAVELQFTHEAGKYHSIKLCPEGFLEKSPKFAEQCTEFKSWEWQVASGPKFTFTGVGKYDNHGDKQLTLEVERGGLISSVNLATVPASGVPGTLETKPNQFLTETLVGCTFEKVAILNRVTQNNADANANMRAFIAQVVDHLD
eukprot:m.161912 g.161912  ORF g.161912 m.161912 type:complete len:415 (-) comp31258_c0_seq4:656-1900(-)